MSNRNQLPILLALFGALLCTQRAVGEGALLLRDICRLKGQEITTLQGLGIVVGLRGTGDADAQATSRALARMMQLMGGQIAVDAQGRLLTNELKEAKNVASVFVTVRVPPAGAQQGDRLDCTINAISAKSLEGGYLMMTPMLGPRADQPTVYAVAEGPLRISEGGIPTSATVQTGAKMQTSIAAPFEKDGRVVLVIERDFADFDVAQSIEDAINNLPENSLDGASPIENPYSNPRARGLRAKAIDSVHVELMVPEIYRQQPIKFLANVLRTPIDLPHNKSRVVINEREGVVVIGEDVRIAPVLITHRNLRIEAARAGVFVPVDPAARASADQQNPKLKALADALNALNVPTADLITVIKALKRKGDLYGEVVFQ
jgi:flagellar P-ring protein precursor FlgI